MARRRQRASVAAAMAEAAAMEDFDEDETGEESVRALVDTARCEICGEVLAQPATTPCGHTFCRECVLSRLEGKGVYASECPRCSMPLRAKDLAPNHAQANVVAAIDALRDTHTHTPVCVCVCVCVSTPPSARETPRASPSPTPRASPVSRTSWATPTTTTSTTTDARSARRPPRPRRLRRRRPPSSAVASSPGRFARSTPLPRSSALD